jgi:hypothetical protein
VERLATEERNGLTEDDFVELYPRLRRFAAVVGDRSDEPDDDGRPAWASEPPEGTTLVIAFVELDDPVALDERRAELARTAGVLDAVSFSRAEAYEEFLQLFGSDPDMVDALTADELPESVQLLVDAARVDEVEDEIGSRPGVWRVVRAVDRWTDGLSFDRGSGTIVTGVPGSMTTATVPRPMPVAPDCVVALVYPSALFDLAPAATPPGWDRSLICEAATAGLVR